MIQSTRGIVLHTSKYSESSIVAQVFTEHAGMQSFIISGVHSRKAKIKPATLLPLTLIDAVVYMKESRGLQRLSELHVDPPYTSIHTDIRKTSIALFLSEVLRKSLKESHPDPTLFQFLHLSLCAFDAMHEGINTFHLYFLLQLTGHLGFFPAGEFSDSTCIWNLPEGCFQKEIPPHFYYVMLPESKLVDALLHSNLGNFSAVSISAPQRLLLLDKIAEYYRIHISGFGELKSLKVLSEVMG